MTKMLMQVSFITYGIIFVVLTSCEPNKTPTAVISEVDEKMEVKYEGDESVKLVQTIIEKVRDNKSRFELNIEYNQCFGTNYYRYVFGGGSEFVQIEGFNRKDTIVRWRSSNSLHDRTKLINQFDSLIDEIKYEIIPAGHNYIVEIIDNDTLVFDAKKLNGLLHLIDKNDPN
jgi:hypothetical protein